MYIASCSEASFMVLTRIPTEHYKCCTWLMKRSSCVHIKSYWHTNEGFWSTFQLPKLYKQIAQVFGCKTRFAVLDIRVTCSPASVSWRQVRLSAGAIWRHLACMRATHALWCTNLRTEIMTSFTTSVAI